MNSENVRMHKYYIEEKNEKKKCCFKREAQCIMLNVKEEFRFVDKEIRINDTRKENPGSKKGRERLERIKLKQQKDKRI